MNRILVIEDDQAMRGQMAQVLRFEGFEPIEAANGKLGVEYALSAAPDLILCDIMMPELDGFGVLQKLRDNPRTATTPFIFITALAANHQRRHGMEEGADDYIVKPFNPKTLIQSVRRRLEKRQRQLEEARRRTDEVSLAVAASVPAEVMETLHHITTVTDLLAMSPGKGTAQIGEAQRAITRASDRLRRMMKRLHLYGQLAQLDAPRSDVRPADETALLGPEVERAAREVCRSWNRNSDLVIAWETTRLPLRQEYLLQVVEELVENACKFSPVSTAIEVTGRSLGGAYLLTVINRGVGMTSDQIASIGAFQQFGAEGKRPPGLGLGLALTQGIARLHGFDFSLQSDGGVTTASVRIPLEA